jgi:hypothetical protein
MEQSTTALPLDGSSPADSKPETERENFLHLARRCWPGWDIDCTCSTDEYTATYAVVFPCICAVWLTSSCAEAQSLARDWCLHNCCDRKRHRLIPVALWVKHARV